MPKLTCIPSSSNFAFWSAVVASLAPLRMRSWILARSVYCGVRLLKVTSSMPSSLALSANSAMRGSPMVPVPTTWTIFLSAREIPLCAATRRDY
jgi:hypothetical protein